MLVVAPLSTLDVHLGEGDLQRRCRQDGAGADRQPPSGGSKLLAEKADIYIINHDGVKVIQRAAAARRDIDVICFDEAAAYRNARAERSKVARQLAKGTQVRLGHDRSPTPSDPTDAFGLAHLITPETAPRSFVQFRQDTMLQVSASSSGCRARTQPETVRKLLQPSVRYTLDDIVELPPVIERDIEVPMGKRQQQVYDAAARSTRCGDAEGRHDHRRQRRRGVLQDAAGSLGWVYGDKDARSIALDNDARLEALIDLIEARRAARSSCSRRSSRRRTASAERAEAREDIDFANVTGDTPQRRTHRDLQRRSSSTDKYHVLNAHPECMSHGLTLTAADTIIWFGPMTKLETYEQANARITRVGQTHKQQVIKLVATPAERMLYKRLANEGHAGERARHARSNHRGAEHDHSQMNVTAPIS